MRSLAWITAIAAAAVGCGRTLLFSEDDQATGEDTSAWLLTIDTNGYAILTVDLDNGHTDTLCALPADGARYISAVFDGNGELLVTYRVASAPDAPVRFARIDPCNCARTPLREYDGGAPAGLAWAGDQLFAIDHAGDTLLRLDPQDGTTTPVGALGVDINSHGASASDRDDEIVVLDAATRSLYRIDTGSGRATRDVQLSRTLGSVGLELHPETGLMYACTDDALLYAVDPDTGRTATIGPMDLPGTCTNLAAPRGAIACVAR